MFKRAFCWFLTCASSVQYISSHPISARSILMLYTHLHLGLLSCSFHPAFSPIAYMCPSSPPLMLHTLSTSSSLTSSFWLYLAKITSYEAVHYAALSNLLARHLCLVQISSSAPCSQTPSVHVAALISETKFRTHTEPQAKLWSCIFKCLSFR
jgi:hypothetical protein